MMTNQQIESVLARELPDYDELVRLGCKPFLLQEYRRQRLGEKLMLKTNEETDGKTDW